MGQLDSTVYWQRYFNLSCVTILDDIHYFRHHLGGKVRDKNAVDTTRKYYPYPLEVLNALFHCINQCLPIRFNCRRHRSMDYSDLLRDRGCNLEALKATVLRNNDCTTRQYTSCGFFYTDFPQGFAFRCKSHELACIGVIQLPHTYPVPYKHCLAGLIILYCKCIDTIKLCNCFLYCSKQTIFT